MLLARIAGVTFLLGGDVEPEGQATLATALPGAPRRRAEGAPPRQPLPGPGPFLLSLGARLAVISVGADNDYGHPAARDRAALAETGARVLRTDRTATVAVVETPAGSAW